jgi:serine/threonine-protein kinase
MHANPFSFGNPIRDPARFYGRVEDINKIVNRLRSSAHESTSVVGERRIGKTSLLKYLDNPAVATGLGLPPEEYCMVYIDFQGLSDITPEAFWRRVLHKIERSICLPDLAPEIQRLRRMDAFDLFDLEDLFDMIADVGLTTVLLLDEFEYVTRNPNFGPGFFGGLRSLAIHQNLPLVTSTQHELVNLCHSEEIKGSPFFNIFANLVLRPFSKEEVFEMLDGYIVDTELIFSPREKELVI